MKNKGFGHLKARLFTIKTSKNVGLGGPWYIYPSLPKTRPHLHVIVSISTMWLFLFRDVVGKRIVVGNEDTSLDAEQQLWVF